MSHPKSRQKSRRDYPRGGDSLNLWLVDTAGWNNKQVQPNSFHLLPAKNLELAKGFEPPTA
jgi:hypothetical protein